MRDINSQNYEGHHALGSAHPVSHQVIERIYESLGLPSLPDIIIQDRSVMISNRNNQFLTKFPIQIDGHNYVIQIMGDNNLLEFTRKISDRSNPLLVGNTQMPTNKVNVGEIIRADIPNGALWQLLNSDGVPLNTNEIFWNHFRKRIPSTHPLSNIPIH